MRRIALICRDSGQLVDGIRDHAVVKAHAVRELGVRADVVGIRRPGSWTVVDSDPGTAWDAATRALPAYDAICLEYNPFLYGRWGFAPWLPAWLARLRLRRPRPTIGVMVHETFVGPEGWRWALMGAWQRAQLAGLLRTADCVFSSLENWCGVLQRWSGSQVAHLPVGSNLPDRREHRAGQRANLGIGAETPVVVTFWTPHPSRDPAYLQRALSAVAEIASTVVLLNLGAGSPEIAGMPDSVQVIRPGLLAPDALASHLAAGDIFLAPFLDGVSTRRGTVLAALQHALAVVGTDGRLTDSCLRRENALLLVPADQPEIFAGAARSLATDSSRRAALAQGGRDLYESTFAWPVLAGSFIERLLGSADSCLPASATGSA
jgi:glycosyltransferase involved in cell wall biosynthesis